MYSEASKHSTLSKGNIRSPEKFSINSASEGNKNAHDVPEFNLDSLPYDNDQDLLKIITLCEEKNTSKGNQ